MLLFLKVGVAMATKCCFIFSKLFSLCKFAFKIRMYTHTYLCSLSLPALQKDTGHFNPSSETHSEGDDTCLFAVHTIIPKLIYIPLEECRLDAVLHPSNYYYLMIGFLPFFQNLFAMFFMLPPVLVSEVFLPLP